MGRSTIAAATPADVAAIVALEADCQGADAWSAALIGDGVAGAVPTVSYFLARRGPVIGYAVASVAGDVVELQRIGVDPAHRRRGVAGELLDQVVEVARAADADRVLLEVREDNAGALAFYAARGFVELARRQRYYRDGASAVVMERSVTGPDVNVCATR